MSYYTQDNDHSAVTGGIGTEDLQVYATQFSVDHQIDSVHSYHLDTGLDIISSASTDNIDRVKSSASKTDGRTHINLGYGHYFKKSGIQSGVQAGLSVESDYTSVGGGINLNKANLSQSRQFSLAFTAYFDDLRWGRLHRGKETLKLIYPDEIRDTTWFTNYKRNSFNLDLGFFQVINERLTLGVYPGIAYQSGLLSTPFHRVFFSDNSLRVENFPSNRIKFPVGVQLNAFIGGQWIMRTYYRYYRDNFGIAAHTLNLDAAFKFSPAITLTALFRVYDQNASDYFKPYKEHVAGEEFYTSDYDLSSFTSYKPGVSLRIAPYSRAALTSLKALEVRYAYYRRSDGLKAHAVTLFIDLTVDTRYRR